MRVRAACHAGTRPKTRPVTIETASVNASVQPSTAMSAARGRSRGAIAATARTPTAASARPTMLLRPESSRLSTSSWRTIWNRVAPSARRTAISDCRAAARASSMCATLAQAISRTKPTATSSTVRPSRVWPTTRSFSGTTCTLRLVPGTPLRGGGDDVDVGLRRGRDDAGLQPREHAEAVAAAVVAAPSSGSGAHSSAFTAQNGANTKRGGITPTTV